MLLALCTHHPRQYSSDGGGEWRVHRDISRRSMRIIDRQCGKNRPSYPVSPRRGIHQWSHAAGGVVQTNECTVTFKCEGCGVRKPEAERYRPRSLCTVCAQACFETAAQQKAHTLHDP